MKWDPLHDRIECRSRDRSQIFRFSHFPTQYPGADPGLRDPSGLLFSIVEFRKDPQ